MKQLFYTLFAVIIISGCSKSSDTTVKKNTSQQQTLTGNYKLFHVADTTYISAASNASIQQIEMKWQGGDTTYFNPGTKYYAVSVYQQYNPTEELADTLVFKTATTGVQNQSFGLTTNFAYSAQNKTYADSNQDTGETQRLVLINATTIEVLTNLTTDHYGAYYIKL